MNRGWFRHQGANHPRWGVDIMDGSESKAEPSTLRVNITDGAESKAEPSTQRADIAEGSDTRGRTVHVGGMYRGRFGYQWLNHPR